MTETQTQTSILISSDVDRQTKTGAILEILLISMKKRIAELCLFVPSHRKPRPTRRIGYDNHYSDYPLVINEGIRDFITKHPSMKLCLQRVSYTKREGEGNVPRKYKKPSGRSWQCEYEEHEHDFPFKPTGKCCTKLISKELRKYCSPECAKAARKQQDRERKVEEKLSQSLRGIELFKWKYRKYLKDKKRKDNKKVKLAKRKPDWNDADRNYDDNADEALDEAGDYGKVCRW